MPVLGKLEKGDLYAKVKVILSVELTDEEIALFQQLQGLRKNRGIE